jgi:hypothetical protein
MADEGVFFKVAAEGETRECLVSRNALQYLGRLANNGSTIGTYAAFESDIRDVACRLIRAGEPSSPLILGAAYFVGLSTSRTSPGA